MDKAFKIMFISGLVFFVTGLSAHADSLYKVAKKLAKAAKQLENKRIAVLVFPYENGDLSSGSTLVSEQLTTLLAERHDVKVMERSLLANVLSEIKLEESGVIDSSDAAKPGNMQGVDAIVTGTLEDQEDGRTIANIRLIQMPTGNILASATATIDREWDDLPHAPPSYEMSQAEEDEPYVLHASKMIYTPWVREGPASAPVHEYEPVVAGGSGAAVSSPPPEIAMTNPAPVAEQNPVAVAVVAYPGRPAPFKRDVRSQLFYAMGVTLDLQGHHDQAHRFYRQALPDKPFPSPFPVQHSPQRPFPNNPSH